MDISSTNLSWQVPAQWIRGRSPLAQTLIWGVCLGPGLVTRNPYATMWLLPLFIALQPHSLMIIALGIAIGGLHGSGRAFGILYNRKRLHAGCTALHILGTHRMWRLLDGVILLALAGAFVASLLPPLKSPF